MWAAFESHFIATIPENDKLVTLMRTYEESGEMTDVELTYLATNGNVTKKERIQNTTRRMGFPVKDVIRDNNGTWLWSELNGEYCYIKLNSEGKIIKENCNSNFRPTSNNKFFAKRCRIASCIRIELLRVQ